MTRWVAVTGTPDEVAEKLSKLRIMKTADGLSAISAPALDHGTVVIFAFIYEKEK